MIEILSNSKTDIAALTRAEKVDILTPDKLNNRPFAKSLAGVSGELEVLLPLEGLVDFDALIARLKKDLMKAEKEILTLNNRLENNNFIKKAPEKVVLDCRKKLSEAKTQADLVKKRLTSLI